VEDEAQHSKYAQGPCALGLPQRFQRLWRTQHSKADTQKGSALLACRRSCFGRGGRSKAEPVSTQKGPALLAASAHKHQESLVGLAGAALRGLQGQAGWQCQLFAAETADTDGRQTAVPQLATP
jgi:hypothetical protein